MKKRVLCFLLALVLMVPLTAFAAAGRTQDVTETPAWSSACRSFVLENGYRRTDQTWTEAPTFALHDMDGDGIPELLACNNALESADRTAYVYVSSSSGLQYAGKAGVCGPADHFAPGSGYPGLYSLDGSAKEACEGVYYSLRGGQVVAEPVLNIGRDQNNTASDSYVVIQSTKDVKLFAAFAPTTADRMWQAGGEALTYRTIQEIRTMGWDAFVTESLRADNTLFSDVSLGHWAWPYAQYTCEKGLMTGTGEGIFSPNGVISRGQVVTILYRLSGSPQVEGGPSFPDVVEGAWYALPARWAVSIQIADAEDGKFLPDRTMERQELALILYRYTQYQGMSTPTGVAVFPDWDQVRDDCVEAMYWAVGVGLINGTGDGRLDPSGSLTRAQLAAMLQRFCENVLNK